MIVVNIAGLVLIAAIVVWFWMWRPRAAVSPGSASGTFDIRVANGVYTPDVLSARRGQPLTLNFYREDASPCAEQVVFHDLGISETLPVGQTKTIRLTPEKTGTFRFTCQMQMYQGVLKVIDG